MILKDIEHLAVDIESIRPWHKNARNGDVGMISESLRRNGQYKPILVQRSTGKIIAGNHTWRAARALKWEKIAVQTIDCTDDQAERIVLVDNRASDLATYDYDILKDQLTLLPDLAGTGYAMEDIETLGELVDEPFTPEPGHKPQTLTATINFDTEGQQETWHSFLRWIRENRDGSTDAAKITALALELMDNT